MKGSSRRTNDPFVNTPVSCAQVTKTDNWGYRLRNCLHGMMLGGMFICVCT